MRLLVLVAVFACTLSAHAQDRVVLKVAPSPGALAIENGRLLITLASGEKVSVALQDADLEATKAAAPPRVATADAYDTSSIRPACEKQWDTDFRMRAFCEKQQTDAIGVLKTRAMTTDDQRAIRTNCIRQWSSDFRMRNFCEEQQLKALASLK